MCKCVLQSPWKEHCSGWHGKKWAVVSKTKTVSDVSDPIWFYSQDRLVPEVCRLWGGWYIKTGGWKYPVDRSAWNNER